jgi:hypothetical protein
VLKVPTAGCGLLDWTSSLKTETARVVWKWKYTWWAEIGKVNASIEGIYKKSAVRNGSQESGYDSSACERKCEKNLLGIVVTVGEELLIASPASTYVI